jgi:hypothetical protein
MFRYLLSLHPKWVQYLFSIYLAYMSAWNLNSRAERERMLCMEYGVRVD